MKAIIYKFLFGCLPVRISLALIAKYIDVKYLPVMAIFTSIISLGFFITYWNNSSDTGFFGGVIWWNNYRLIHSFTFGLFSILAFSKYTNSWLVLLADVCIGLLFFIHNYNMK